MKTFDKNEKSCYIPSPFHRFVLSLQQRLYKAHTIK